MNDDEARKVAQHCIDAWPNGPKAYIWRELLTDLDYGTAIGAYKALVRESEKTPTPGRFMAHYDNLTRPVDRYQPAASSEERISLGEYLERLQLRATKGNPEAQTELDRWHRHLTGKSKYSHRRTPDTDDAA